MELAVEINASVNPKVIYPTNVENMPFATSMNKYAAQNDAIHRIIKDSLSPYEVSQSSGVFKGIRCS